MFLEIYKKVYVRIKGIRIPIEKLNFARGYILTCTYNLSKKNIIFASKNKHVGLYK